MRSFVGAVLATDWPGNAATEIHGFLHVSATPLGQPAYAKPIPMAGPKTHPRADAGHVAQVHADGMQQHISLTVIGRSTMGLPRTYRVERPGMAPRPVDADRNLAYRRLTASILSLDVASLAHKLRATRMRRSEFDLAA